VRNGYGTEINQSELGELCGVTKAAVSQWETGVSMPEINKLIELRSKLVFSLDWFITGKEEVLDSYGVTPKVKEWRQAVRRSSDGNNTP
jgi:transcriptional regulator with XRE-family HTH domain